MPATRQYVDTATRRRQVAEAALQTVAQDGVARFTTRAVAARVGISEGTLFRHFGSKAEVVLEAMKLLEVGIDAGLERSDDPRGDLERFFRHRAAFVGAQSSVGRLIFSDELVHLAGEEGRAQVSSWRERSVAFMMDRLGALQPGGELRSELDPPAMCMLVQGVLLTFAMQASLAQGGTFDELQVRIDDAWRALHVVLFSA